MIKKIIITRLVIGTSRTVGSAKKFVRITSGFGGGEFTKTLRKVCTCQKLKFSFLLLEYCKIRECYAVANAFTIRNMSSLFLDLYLEFDDSGQLSTKIYDKRDDFNFKIINFPNMCSNIPASPAYGVYISQLIRYARASSNYSDFLKRHLHLRSRLLDQGYKKIRLIRSLKKFIFRYQYLVEIYSVSAEIIISDAFSYSENV